MLDPSDPFGPRGLAAWEPAGHAPAGELAWLRALAEAGDPVAPLVVVPSAAEERFYRLHNLPERLRRLFAAVDPADPDEDDLEELAPEAQHLFDGSFFLDEFIDQFYDAIDALPERLELRRPGGAPGRVARRGRQALLALKGIWRDDWSYDALVARLGRERTVGLEPRPTLIHAAGDAPDRVASERAGALLGLPVRVWGHPSYGLTRVWPAAE